MPSRLVLKKFERNGNVGYGQVLVDVKPRKKKAPKKSPRRKK